MSLSVQFKASTLALMGFVYAFVQEKLDHNARRFPVEAKSRDDTAVRARDLHEPEALDG
jgi:hypothetical protein